VPAIEDPNTGITLWESGAIEYLVETYDKQHNISFAPGSKENYKAKQWLYYQVSGQGPYFGQAVWFTRYHSEKLPSAVDRYVNEIRRVSGVLDRALQDKEFLVGGKFSYADAAFVTWYAIVFPFADRFNLETDFPLLNAWLERIKAHPAIQRSCGTGMRLWRPSKSVLGVKGICLARSILLLGLRWSINKVSTK
jgi:glutathione S-transferase